MQTFPAIACQSGIEQRRFKRSYICHDEGLIDQVRRAFARDGVQAKVIYSHARLLDILPHAAGKGAAARHVAARMGLPETHMIVAGDSGNDEDTIHACRNPILVASRPYAAGVLEGLIAIAETISSRSAA